MTQMARPVGWNGALAELVALNALGGDRFESRASVPMPGDRIFGGQILAHALAAAINTAPGRTPHSAHAYFIAAGSGAHSITLTVERVRDGGRFSLRQVEAFQNGRLLIRLACSFRTTLDDTFDHQINAATPLPAPEACESYDAFVDREGDTVARQMRDRLRSIGTPMEIRHIGERVVGAEPRPPERRFWFRLPGAAAITDPAVHTALLAYLSDVWMAGTAMVPHYGALMDGYPAMISLDHALWFHRPARVDDWLLYAIDSPAMSGGTGLTRGLLYDRTGRLVASTAQEAMASVAKQPI